MKNLYIYGNGGLGRETFDIAVAVNQMKEAWHRIYFINDFENGNPCMGIPVLPLETALEQKSPGDEFIVAVGEPDKRKMLYAKLAEKNCLMADIQAPGFRKFPTVEVGKGSIVSWGAVITSCAHIGRCCVVNDNSTVGHDVQIGDFCVVCPGVTIGGFTEIGGETFIGSGTVVRDRIRIGKNCVIGMGSIVTRDLPDNTVAYGSPAKIIRKNINQNIFK